MTDRFFTYSQVIFYVWRPYKSPMNLPQWCYNPYRIQHPYTLESDIKTPPKINKDKLWETLRRATEEESLFQSRQTCNTPGSGATSEYSERFNNHILRFCYHDGNIVSPVMGQRAIQFEKSMMGLQEAAEVISVQRHHHGDVVHAAEWKKRFSQDVLLRHFFQNLKKKTK